MKNIFLIIMLFACSSSRAQLIDKLAKKTQKASERAIERKAEQKATKATNDAIDNVLNDKSKSKTTTSSNSNSKTISKSTSDFVSGTKILFEENFRLDAIGDFPLKWYTNSSGEIVTFEGSNTKWLQLSDKGSFTPLNISKLPENFTFEFDVTMTDNFNFYSTRLNVVFTEKISKTDNIWNPALRRNKGVIFNIHPSNSLAGSGKSEVFVIANKKEILKNNVAIPDFSNKNNLVRVQIWRQKTRFRMYVDGKKIWDLPMAFDDTNYNQIIFFIGTYKKPVDKIFISNIKLAEATSDKRHELIETGSFSTSEILFDTNKSTIKGSSANILNDLGKALTENSAIKIKITGHTDSDGDEKSNQTLSENRAESVKDYLVKNFSIDNNRIATYGKGSYEPISKNNTEEGKKQNRRVVFEVVDFK